MVSAPGLLNPLAPADRLVTLPAGEPQFTLGWGVATWAAKYLKVPNGPDAGRPWKFTPGQLDFVLWWYAVDEDGRWLFQHGVRRLSKGTGKSPSAGCLCICELCGPVRFSHFCEVDPEDPWTWGGVRGKAVDMPLVQIAATSESQTANTNRMVRAMMPKGSRLVRDYDLDPGKTVTYAGSGGQLEIITSSAAAAEGALTTFAVLDETELWIPSNGGAELASVIDRNLAKSSSRGIETANAWAPGSGSVAEDTYDAWVAQEEGRTKSGAKILYDALVAPADTDLTDVASLEAGVTHAYRDSPWVDKRTIMDRILSLRTKPDIARRFYLNQPVASSDSWVTPQEWASIADPTQVIADGDEIVAFFDGSRTRDATALIACHVETGYVFTVDVWEPDAGASHGPDGAEIPVDEVDAAVERMFERWDVRAMFADVREWESFTKVTWPKRYGDDLELHAVPGGKDPQPIAWDMRTRTYDFTMACELTLTEIAERAFRHDGDSRTGRHVVNCRRHPNRWGVSVAKESRDSPKKIDAAVCVIGARMVRRLLLAQRAAQPVKKPRSGRVYGFA